MQIIRSIHQSYNSQCDCEFQSPLKTPSPCHRRRNDGTILFGVLKSNSLISKARHEVQCDAMDIGPADPLEPINNQPCMPCVKEKGQKAHRPKCRIVAFDLPRSCVGIQRYTESQRICARSPKIPTAWALGVPRFLIVKPRQPHTSLGFYRDGVNLCAQNAHHTGDRSCACAM